MLVWAYLLSWTDIRTFHLEDSHLSTLLTSSYWIYNFVGCILAMPCRFCIVVHMFRALLMQMNPGVCIMNKSLFMKIMNHFLQSIVQVLALSPGPTFIKLNQFDPWIKDELGKALLPKILPLQLQNVVLGGRACPSHKTQTFVTVGAKLLTGGGFSLDLKSMDQSNPVS